MKGWNKKYILIGLGGAAVAVVVAVAIFAGVLWDGINPVEIDPDSQLIPAVQEQKQLVLSEATADTLYAAWAQEVLAGMTLEEKVGQMFIARCPSVSAAETVKEYHLGGYILFARDFHGENHETVKTEIRAYQENARIKLLIGVDEEGGKVRRISQNPQYGVMPFLSPQELFHQGGYERIAKDTAEKADLLLSLGINVNFAPVCDVSINPEDYIYRRTLGQDAKMTANYVETVVAVMGEKHLGSVLKHFPGYGNNRDTHTGGALDLRPYETFQSRDFLPFVAGICAGADSVLVSHNTVVSMDPDYPASLSPVVHEILRQELGFEGVIVTDDLVMEAVRAVAEPAEAAVLAVEAGNDLLCSTDFEVQIPAVLEAVKSGRLSETQIEQSVIRLLSWKYKLGLLSPNDDFYTVADFLTREVYLPFEQRK